MSQLKDIYFQAGMLNTLASGIESVRPGFSGSEFISAVLSDPWSELELMDRMRGITRCLREFLPVDYPEALKTLRAVAPRITGFDSLVFPDFVRQYGLDFPRESIPALEQFTELGSSEFAVRPFIERYPEQMWKQLDLWARSKNKHHRRLASEGCRPRLPWAAALNGLKKDPSPIFPILELLKSDPEDYVRRSVANNLNDISKDHPDLVIARVKAWQATGKASDWIIKHACRTMLKQGRPDVLQLFGFSSPSSVSASAVRFDKERIGIGEEVTFQCTLKTNKISFGKLRLEYVVDFIKSNGRPSPKVFQIAERVETVSELVIEKRHSFKNLTTRKHFPGIHRFIIRVNGIARGEGSVELTA